jgi:hypothetical protein
MRIVKHPLQNQPGETRLKIIYNAREKQIRKDGQHFVGGAYHGSQLTGYPTGTQCCGECIGYSDCTPDACSCVR